MADPFEDMVDTFKDLFGPFWPGSWKTERAKEFSRWNHVFPSASFSPQEFYAAMEESIRQKKLPEVGLGRVTWKERGLFSARREYLRVERDRYVYDICAAPFGKDFFFSSWLVILPRKLTVMQILGMKFGDAYPKNNSSVTCPYRRSSAFIGGCNSSTHLTTHSYCASA